MVLLMIAQVIAVLSDFPTRRYNVQRRNILSMRRMFEPEIKAKSFPDLVEEIRSSL